MNKTIRLAGFVAMILCVVLLSQCKSRGDGGGHSQKNKKKMQKMIPELSAWYPRLQLDRVALEKWLDGPAMRVNVDFAYEGWEHLTRIYNDSIDVGSYYLDGKRVALIFLMDDKLLEPLSPAQMFALLGQPTPMQTMGASTAKQAILYVFAEDGIAFAVENGQVDYIELFHPMTLQAYLSKIYRAPGPWEE